MATPPRGRPSEARTSRGKGALDPRAGSVCVPAFVFEKIRDPTESGIQRDYAE